MKAIRLHELGGPEKLTYEDVPLRDLRSGEVAVRLKAAALNHRDVWIRKGLYAGIKLPVILGSDGAGVVSAVGPDVDSSLNNRDVVINPSLGWGTDEKVQSASFKILGLPDDGTYAEFVIVPVANVLPKPTSLSFEEAAAIPLASLTAYRALVTRAQINRGETVVITGIGGGVSTFALLIARKLGARVFVTSGSEAKLKRANDLGASGGVNYRTGEWVKELSEMCGNGGPDVIIDSAGGDTFTKAIELVKPGGRIVTFGATTGASKQIEVRRIFWKQLTICGSTMGTSEEFSRALAMFSDGTLKPIIDSVHPLADAQEAHRKMEEAEQFGKIVLQID
ncbi:MAG: zinc-binding dehydrogenase [Ignavibacteria bacterium]|nr:zinc-binding dehydrogenase [Ignavibacteria bacterium]